MSISNTPPLANAQPSGTAETTQAETDSVAHTSEPDLKVHHLNPPTDWRDLPADILGRLFTGFLDQALSTSLTPGIRFEALKAAQQLGSVAKLENLVLHAELKYGHIDLQKLETELRHSLTKEWRSSAETMAEQQDKLVEDFAATRKMLATAHVSGAPPHVDSSHEGIHLCLAEVTLQSLSTSFLAGLEGKTVKFDATGVGRERFINEILTTLAKLPPSCKLVLDARNNDLTADDIDKLTDVMAMKPVIYRLDLGGNPLVDGAHPQQSIARLFAHAGPLAHLNLDGTGFDNTTAIGLKDSFSRAQCLKRIDLRNNLLDADGAIELISGILGDSSDVTQLARLGSLHAVRLGGNPYMDREWEVRAALDDFTNMANALKDAAYLAAVEAGFDGNPSPYIDARRIFEIYGPSENPQVNAFIRMCDARAEAVRL